MRMDNFDISECNFESDQWFKFELALAAIGILVYICAAQVPRILDCFHDKEWYDEFMTFLIALSMGTMYCVTLAQFIPEAFGKANDIYDPWEDSLWEDSLQPCSLSFH